MRSTTRIQSHKIWMIQRSGLCRKPSGLQAGIKAICFYPFIMTIELQDAAVSQLIAPKRGTQWEPFLT